MSKDTHIDVAIVTAVKDEWDAVLDVETGATLGSRWELERTPSGAEVAFRKFLKPSGKELLFGVVQASGMGGSFAIAAAHELLAFEPHCLAMCGVCAGLRGDVALGDVVIADRVWQYDTGKLKSAIVDGTRVEQIKADIDMYRLHPPEWRQNAERFESLLGTPEWLKERPRTFEAQGDWILERLASGADPNSDPEQKFLCADWGIVIQRLWKQGLLEQGSLKPTEKGLAHIRPLLIVNRGKLPKPPDFRIHVGPMASGNRVIEDAEIFRLLANNVRKILAVEMEAAAIAALSHLKELKYSVVMKGVMDHADSDKSDNFKKFAAKASAECLVAFLRHHLPPAERKSAPKSAEPAWIANDKDDVVLSMHPMAQGVWRRALPNGAELNLQEFVIWTPPERWHVTEPVTSDRWLEVAQSIDAQLQRLLSVNWQRLHVFANAPYSLGLLLGHQLFQRFGRGKELVLYQFSRPGEPWADWGSSRRLPAELRDSPFLQSTTGGASASEAQHLVISISITHKVNPEEVDHAMATIVATEAVSRLDIIPKDGTGPNALKDPSSVDRCVDELEEFLAGAATDYDKATRHVFYVGPLVVLMRAAARLHVPAKPLIFYDRIQVSGAPEFVPALALELRGTRLLMGPAPQGAQDGAPRGQL